MKNIINWADLEYSFKPQLIDEIKEKIKGLDYQNDRMEFWGYGFAGDGDCVNLEFYNQTKAISFRINV
jgi:hypothetical protein|tara:strand:+ start:503 stop:706 length:204 start_codon:yes stop_codon:yes gene_type:complete